MYKTMYDKLHLCQLNAEQHARTCGYWYTVTSHATSHTAFRTEKALMLWLNERGLELSEPLVERGQWAAQFIQGKYKVASHIDRAEFDALTPVLESRDCDNAEYTLAKITEDNGVRTVHHMNCNYPRVQFNYRESDDIHTGGWNE